MKSILTIAAAMAHLAPEDYSPMDFVYSTPLPRNKKPTGALKGKRAARKARNRRRTRA
jgi:hypothetical protein